MQRGRHTVVVFSGGLDSTTLLYHLRAEGHDVRAISVNYGQRHSRELESARTITQRLNIEHRIVDLSGLASLFGQNALTDHSVTVPHGEYSAVTIPVTTVPNRNMILLSLATGWAIASKCDSVAFGAHGGEYTPYADCKPLFAATMNAATHACDDMPVEVLSPFVRWHKTDIVRRGLELDVPFELTWSCYEGGTKACGKCSTCRDRDEAFANIGLPDPVTSTRLDTNTP
ncbi:MAG: 7-cyano-7-deazaguanine synthase QueC [Planctomycetota bacterium]|nr:7-cyano-7-deazaguanine synthase QueC [Planctomycetota bacterium]